MWDSLFLSPEMLVKSHLWESRIRQKEGMGWDLFFKSCPSALKTWISLLVPLVSVKRK